MTARKLDAPTGQPVEAHGPTRLRGNPARLRTGVLTSDPLATGIARAHRREQPPERRDCHVCHTSFPPKSARQVVCGRICAVANAREHLGGTP